MRIASLILIGLFVLTLHSCQKDETLITSQALSTYDASVAHSWTTASLKMIKETPGFSPPVAARALAYTSLTMYEAGRYGSQDINTMQGKISGFEPNSLPQPDNASYSWPIVVNAAAKEIYMACFANAKETNLDIINATYSANLALYEGQSQPQIVDRSIAFGVLVGKSMVAYASGDNQVECYKTNFPSNYSIPQGLGKWVPTGTQSIPLQPYWGSVRSFAQANVDVVPVPHPDFSTDPASDFYKEALDVYLVSKNLSERQKIIANYWADDPGKTATPPGHSMSITKGLLIKEKADLEEALLLYAQMGLGLHDAFVSCWKSKYNYNLLRPLTYIRTYIDNQWNTLIGTPPFPEYTSGHSVQSGAAAEILTAHFGASYAFIDDTHAGRTDINGNPRAFINFEKFAQEAAISRLYGGIHFQAGIDNGVSQGKEVGKNIINLDW